jgi:hypothetical protein
MGYIVSNNRLTMDGRGFSRVTRRKGKKTSCARPPSIRKPPTAVQNLGIKKPRPEIPEEVFMVS